MVNSSGFIRREVMGGEYFGRYQTEIGELFIISDAEAITAILFALPNGRRLKPEATVLTNRAACQINEFLAGTRKVFDLPLKPAGTSFQRTIWSCLLDIPYGETCTYCDIAKASGNPRAVRAVGQASKRNPIPIVVPNHRVIGSNGTLVSYGGDLRIKKQLLQLENRLIE